MRIRIAWRDGAYYVDRPCFDGGEVITVEAIEHQLDDARASAGVASGKQRDRLRGQVEALEALLVQCPPKSRPLAIPAGISRAPGDGGQVFDTAAPLIGGARSARPTLDLGLYVAVRENGDRVSTMIQVFTPREPGRIASGELAGTPFTLPLTYMVEADVEYFLELHAESVTARIGRVDESKRVRRVLKLSRAKGVAYA